MPFLEAMNSKALSIRPPWQPWSWPLSHDTRLCSESEVSLPEAISNAPSTAPIAEKAQQLPQRPWFLMSVTAPSVTQSFESGALSTVSTVSAGWTKTRCELIGARLR